MSYQDRIYLVIMLYIFGAAALGTSVILGAIYDKWQSIRGKRPRKGA
jgi:hypothetical protein